MSKSRDETLKTLSNLLRHQQSAAAMENVGEAANFAAKIAELSIKYNITQQEIEERMRIEQDRVSTDFFSHKIEVDIRHIKWQKLLATIVAKGHFCSILLSETNDTVRFVGTIENLAVCQAMFTILNRSAVACYEKHHEILVEIAPKHAKRDFFYGFVATISKRYEEMRLEKSEALVRIGQNLTKFMSDRFKPSDSTDVSTKINNILAMMAGRSEAEELSLEINQIYAQKTQKRLE